jgi:peroxiredoxin Q/BCP
VKRILLIMFASLFSFFSNAAEKLAVGAAIPAVQCPDQDGQVVDLPKVGAKGYLLVYFYPKASTPGCTKQGCSLRDSWSVLQKAGVQVFGVSTDSEEWPAAPPSCSRMASVSGSIPRGRRPIRPSRYSPS